MTHIAVVNGLHVCYQTDDGIRRRFAGCAHETPRAAIAHVANLDPFVSPTSRPASDVARIQPEASDLPPVASRAVRSSRRTT